MIPDLTLIVAVYVVVRLLALVARQFPEAEKRWPARILLTVFASAAILATVVATYSTMTSSVDLMKPGGGLGTRNTPNPWP